MKSYGLDLQHSDINSKASEIASGIAFPDSPLVGAMFFLTTPLTGFPKGEYSYDGTSWLLNSNSPGDSFLPGGANALPTAAPTGTLSPTSTNAEGTAHSFARSDHSHQIEGFATNDPDPIALAIIFGS